MPNPENIKGKGFNKFPEHINRKGQPVTRPLKDYLIELEKEDNKVVIPLSACEIVGDKVIIRLPSKNNLAVTLLNNAKKDVRWFQEWAKITGEYASEKKDLTTNGKDINAPMFVFQDWSGKVIDPNE